MKLRGVVLVTSGILAGCAAQYTPEQLAARAKEDSTPNLCAITLMAPPMSVLNAAENELHARSATCDWEQAKAIAANYYARQQAAAEARQAQQANAMALMGMSALFLQQSGPHYYAPPPVNTTCQQQGVFMNCTSY